MTADAIVDELFEVLSTWDGPIAVAYSGGKDSSAVLKLVFNALLRKEELAKKVTVIYCDTKVENPILDDFVKRTLSELKREAAELLPALRVKVLRPALHQRYFVRIIGRGYPPPTTFFRWCTKDLRIRPVQNFVRKSGPRPLVLVGTRQGESAQRDRVLKRASGKDQSGPVFQRQIDGGRETTLYLPIAQCSLEDVWELLSDLDHPTSIDVYRLAELYRHGGGECPMVRDSNDQPCASARFGCWVCTVVRRDRSAEKLLAAGYDQLTGYFEFRAWLSEFRNDHNFRCRRRRNGQIAPGPFTLSARRMILARVRKLEKSIGRPLITPAEEQYIRRLWSEDRRSDRYMQSEAL